MSMMISRRRACAWFSIGAALSFADIARSNEATNAYPLSVEHALGTTTIPNRPSRIVTIGWNGEDALVALGAIPVAMPRRALFDDGMFPWVEERIGSVKPILLASDLDYEQILSLKPDLIMAVFSGIDGKAYRRLSTIAPTVTYRSAPWQADWREQTLMTGLALGKVDVAERLIEQTNAHLRDLAGRYSEMSARTFTFGTFSPGSAAIGVYLPSDPRIQLLLELGLVPSPGIEALAADQPGRRSGSVSLEEISSIDADVLIMWYGPGARAAAEAQPLFNTLEAVKRGSYVALEDPIDVWSTSALSVLSIPYGFPRFVPRLAEAAARANGQ